MFGKKYVCMVLLAFPDALSFWLSGAARSLYIGSSFTAVLSIQRQEKLIRVIRNTLDILCICTSACAPPNQASRQRQLPNSQRCCSAQCIFFATAIYYFITAAKHSSRYWVCACVCKWRANNQLLSLVARCA